MPASVAKDIGPDANGAQERFVGINFRGRIKSVTLSGRDKDCGEPLRRRGLHFGWHVTANGDHGSSVVDAQNGGPVCHRDAL